MEPLGFEDHPFRVEDFKGHSCRFCGATNTFLDEMKDQETGETVFSCSDTSHCLKTLNLEEATP